MTKLILASGSPRRRELLRQIGIKNFEIRIPQHEPKLIDLIAAQSKPPDFAAFAQVTTKIALAKAEEIASTVPMGQLILAADTIVCMQGKAYGKPQDASEAAEMLKRLSGTAHRVYTGVAMLLDGKRLTAAEETTVHFRKLDEDEITSYVATGEPLDKAGSYGIQGRAAHFVRRIEGDVYNVIGLPLFRLFEMAKEMGVRLI